MKRLGFWNRLALVAACLFVFGVPTWLTLSQNREHSRLIYPAYRDCLAEASHNLDPIGQQRCFDTLADDQAAYLGWGDWFTFFAKALLLAVALYAVLWLAVRLIAWVWAGRKVDSRKMP